MEKQRILIVGDSFFAPNETPWAWHNRLKVNYNITNCATNGVGQYKILKQLQSQDGGKFDWVVVGITNPTRIHTERNPFYSTDHSSHAQCDLLYEDIKNKPKSEEKDHALWYFKNILDVDYYDFVQRLILDYTCNILSQQHLLVSFFNIDYDCVSLNQIWQNNPGDVNHLNQHGHDLVYRLLVDTFGKK